MPAISEVYYWMAALAIFFFGGIGLINWLQGGLFLKFLKVKASRGRKVLINIHSQLGNTYPSIGHVEGKFLVFHTRESKIFNKKNPLRIPITDNRAFFRQYGIIFAIFDEASKALMSPKLDGIKTWDPQKWGEIYLRALNKPAPEANKNIFLILILVVCIIALLVAGATYYKLQAVQNALGVLQNVASVGGSNI